jgi:serine/threonine protein kinase
MFWGIELRYAQGVPTRDFKPQNVLMNDLGQDELVDFGLDSLIGHLLTLVERQNRLQIAQWVAVVMGLSELGREVSQTLLPGEKAFKKAEVSPEAKLREAQSRRIAALEWAGIPDALSLEEWQESGLARLAQIHPIPEGLSSLSAQDLSNAVNDMHEVVTILDEAIEYFGRESSAPPSSHGSGTFTRTGLGSEVPSQPRRQQRTASGSLPYGARIKARLRTVKGGLDFKHDNFAIETRGNSTRVGTTSTARPWDGAHFAIRDFRLLPANTRLESLTSQ